jgi:Transglutaminase-like superfamily
MVKFGTFSRIRSFVRRVPVLGVSSPSKTMDQLVESFNRASLLYIRSVQCIQRATALTCLLRLHGIQARFTVGCRSVPFYSHAWVTVDSVAVNEPEDIVTTLQVLDRF